MQIRSIAVPLFAAFLALGSWAALQSGAVADPPKEIILPRDTISAEQWLKASTRPLQPGEIDSIIDSELEKAGIKPAEKTSDEEFLRRVYLDLTGRLPVPADIRDFVSDPDPNKRSKVIDRLLDSDEYAEHWARYWRQVITSRVTDPLNLSLADPFETWMAKQLKNNANWGEIARQMITASGVLRRDGKGEEHAGAAYLFLSRRGNDAIAERTAETSRIFLGIQIQCAQCHDHPFDEWKREQFHQLAAFLARMRERPVRDGQRIVGLQLVSLPFREHRMPDLKNPEKSTVMFPKFLDGSAPKFPRLPDARRRELLAEYITSKSNPWFAAAFVNRIWGELMGQSFYHPIDDLGPQRDAVMPKLVVRLAGAFRGSNYDIKQLFRDIMNSEAYQRKVSLGKSVDQHLLFAARYPKRLNGQALWNSLQCVLGRLDNRRFAARRPGFFGRIRGPEFQFLKEFNYDPSTKPEEVEGSIPQALFLMNNPLIHQKIVALGPNLLGRVLRAYPKDEDALRIVYQRALGRSPTERETSKCLAYIDRVGNRVEAFEDILWVLINSTEFQTRR